MAKKPFYTSKTLWVNAIALGVALAANQGFSIDPETQASLVAGMLAAANIVLRLTTTKGIT